MKFNVYDKASEYVLNKDISVNTYIQYMLSRTQSMFEYKGLPETIPQRDLERLLQTKGYCFVTEIEGKLYALYGGLGGELDVYDNPTEITVANNALKLSKTFNLENEGVLIENDAFKIGLLPILKKYAVLLTENTISMRTVDILLRISCLISASDDKTHTSAEKYISDIENGKISIVGESAFFDGVKLQSITNAQNYVLQFIELEQYLKASCFNEIGLNANYNMKREYIGHNEVSLNDDFLLPLVDNMIKNRKIAIDKINSMYGTNIEIDYASAWKVTHAENEKEVAISEQISSGVNVESVSDSDMSIRGKEETINIGIEGNNENNSENEQSENEGLTENIERVEETGNEETGDESEENEVKIDDEEKDNDRDKS